MLTFLRSAALSALALPIVAHASTMDDFTLTGVDMDVTFALPSQPKPVTWTAGTYFDLGAINIKEYDTPVTTASTYFEANAAFGGFTLLDQYGEVIDDLDFTGPQLFSGRANDPTFKLGTYTLIPASCEAWGPHGPIPGSPCANTLTIAAATTAAPEPGSLALLGTGAVGAISLLRRRLA